MDAFRLDFAEFVLSNTAPEQRQPKLRVDAEITFDQLSLEFLADYELLQPFAQIGRDTYTLSEDETKSLKLERWKGAKVPTGRVLGLVNKG